MVVRTVVQTSLFVAHDIQVPAAWTGAYIPQFYLKKTKEKGASSHKIQTLYYTDGKLPLKTCFDDRNRVCLGFKHFTHNMKASAW